MSPNDSFVGREAEVARLASIVGGRLGPRLALVVGEAGIGKTRLLAEVTAAARADARQVLRGWADEIDRSPFGLWRGVAHQLGLPRLGEDTTVPAAEQRWDTLALLAEALTDHGRCIVVLDDVHWADDDSLWVLERLATDLADRDGSVSLVASSRPMDDPAVGPARARWQSIYQLADVIALAGLGPVAVAELLGSLAATAFDADAVAARTGGNPFLVREVVRAGSGPLPHSITELLGRAVERAGPGTTTTLAVLALAGPETPLPIVAAARATGVAEIESHLAAAQAVDVVRPDAAGRMWFRHALLADATVARIPPAERRAHQAALADAWGRHGSDPVSAAAGARHRLQAVPTVPALDAAAAAEAAIEALLDLGQAAEARELALLAASVVDEHEPDDVTRRARLHLAVGRSRWLLDEVDLAIETCERAAALARRGDDVELIARAEVAAVYQHNPFRPDPGRLARLTELEAALWPEGDENSQGDVALHVQLVGRRASLSASLPDRVADAAGLGDQAIALARTHGDPELLVRAFGDRYFTAMTPEDLDLRAGAADELVHAAEIAGRPDLELAGHEWRVSSRAGAGDLAGALRSQADLETRAALLPSPRWRYAAMLRRSGLVALSGDLDGAMSLLDAATALGRPLVSEMELYGLALGLRLPPALVYGIAGDPEVGRLIEIVGRGMGSIPIAFIQVRQAQVELYLGDIDAARRRLQPWLKQAEAACRTPEGLGTVAALSQCLIELGSRDGAAEARRALQPFAGRLPIINGVGCDLPVDAYLGALALLEDDVDAAIAHAHAALRFSREMPSPPLIARSLALLADAQGRAGDAAAAMSARDAAEATAEPIGMRLPPAAWTAGSAAAVARARSPRRTESTGAKDLEVTDRRRARLRRDAPSSWLVESPLGSGQVADSIGLRQLARLLASPGLEVAAVDLAAVAESGSVVVHADLGPALDARAKREYRQRIVELQSEIDEAESDNDIERAAKHRLELDALLTELQRAIGLGGRDRPQGSGAERARINTARNIRRAIAAIVSVAPDLGAHLSVSVRTGHHCSYAPEPAAALEWTVAS